MNKTLKEITSINITPNRINLLKRIQHTPGLYASGIADLFPRATENSPQRGWSAQGATRFGCGYAQPMVNAGLLRKDKNVQCGGARYFITGKGEAVLAHVACQECHGAGGFEAAMSSTGYFWKQCPLCEGTGVKICD